MPLFRISNYISNFGCKYISLLKAKEKYSNLITFKLNSNKLAGYWMAGGGILVASIIVLGGWTRLTESGLSMVDWKLLHFKPPRTEEQWNAYFLKYQLFPEYILKNKGMTLEEFKRIYFYEHAHRVMGRLIGIYFLLPSFWFTAKLWRKNNPFVRRIWGINLLVVSQGLLGWYMVKSGLSNDLIAQKQVPRVSHLRLAAHLTFALTIYGAALSSAFRLLAPFSASHSRKGLRFGSTICTGLVFCTAISGAFVAGLDAGLICDTFPRMDGAFIPKEFLDLKPAWKNFVYNPTTIQFAHRWLGKITLMGIVALCIFSRKLKATPKQMQRCRLMLALASGQTLLGVSTVKFGVPLAVASAHQATAVALFGSGLWLYASAV